MTKEYSSKGRRGFLRRAGFGIGALALPRVASEGSQATASANLPWTIAVVPDTQFYCRFDRGDERAAIFTAQTRWIRENQMRENIVFVSHLGDVVNNGAVQPIEWERAEHAMRLLNGKMPYSVIHGNHDLNLVGSRSSGTGAFLKHFGRGRYTHHDWYIGSSANQLNHAQRFSAGGRTFLHIGLELEAPDAALAWAQSVIDAHPGLSTIISTHSYQNDTTGRTQHSEFQGNSGRQIWNKLVRLNPQIFLVLNGHFYADHGERTQISHNRAGQAVIEMCSDYQAYPNGGNGWMRLLRFDPAASHMTARTYSPWLNQYLDDTDSRFTVPLSFTERFGTVRSRA